MGRPTEFMRTQQLREEYGRRAQASMLRYMKLKGIDEQTLSVKQHVTKQTIKNRLDNPGKMQLEDIWEMAIILNCPVGELCGGDLPEELISRLIANASLISK